MNQETFNEQLKIKLSKIRELLGSKGKEYIQGDNVFSNFIDGVGVSSLSAPRYLWALLTKHLVSIKDMIANYEKIGYIPNNDYIEEKATDAQNYLILLEFLFKDLKNE